MKERDWAGAAADCERKGVSKERNDGTKALFMAAVEEERKAA